MPTDGRRGSLRGFPIVAGALVREQSEQLEVRWNQPLTDPLLLVATEAGGSPNLADSRSNFFPRISLQRATLRFVANLIALLVPEHLRSLSSGPLP